MLLIIVIAFISLQFLPQTEIHFILIVADPPPSLGEYFLTSILPSLTC